MKKHQLPLAFRQHRLGRDVQTERLVCSVCQWSWKSQPQSDCPGLPRYAYEEIPAGLRHKTALRGMGLKPGGPARGVYYRSGQAGKPTAWCLLYAVVEALPTNPNVDSRPRKGVSDE